jgi:hypothetical protein
MTLENNSDQFEKQNAEQIKDARIEKSPPPVGNITIYKLNESVLIVQAMGGLNIHELEIFNNGTWTDRIKCNEPKKCEETVELQLLEIPNAKLD